MNYTRLMYDAAHEAYRQNKEVHAYTGLVRGLSAVARELGFDLPWQYFSDKHHDPLASLADIFDKETISFEELVRMWDKMWFGLGTGYFHPLPYPFDNAHSVYVSGGYRAVDLGGIAREVQQALKRLKIRRGSKKYDAFVAENAPKVVDATVKVAENSAQAAARDLEQSRKKVSELAMKAAKSRDQLELETKLRQTLLGAAGLSGEPLTTNEITQRLEAWSSAAEILDSKLEFIDKMIAELADSNQTAIIAVETMSHNETLAPFARAAGLVA